MSWFKELFGFEEESPQQVRSQLIWQGTSICSKVNDRCFEVGTLEIPSLEELRNRYQNPNSLVKRIQIKEVIGDALLRKLQQY